MSFERTCDAATARRAVACLDLTDLDDDAEGAGARKLADRGRAAGVAAICVWPRFLGEVKPLLAGCDVRLATVANFPAGSDDVAGAAAEVQAAFTAGADEVDVVAPIEAILAGDVGLVEELVELCVAERPEFGTLKLILETGRLGDPAVVTAAARAAVMGGVDMLKTSTGKADVGATPDAVATLLQVIEEAGGRVGLKVSGGVRTPEQAAGYLALCDERMGAGWAMPATFRIGASSLLDGLLARL
jgi:deoxyribose-phosphate aldolase